MRPEQVSTPTARTSIRSPERKTPATTPVSDARRFFSRSLCGGYGSPTKETRSGLVHLSRSSLLTLPCPGSAGSVLFVEGLDQPDQDMFTLVLKLTHQADLCDSRFTLPAPGSLAFAGWSLRLTRYYPNEAPRPEAEVSGRPPPRGPSTRGRPVAGVDGKLPEVVPVSGRRRPDSCRRLERLGLAARARQLPFARAPDRPRRRPEGVPRALPARL